ALGARTIGSYLQQFVVQDGQEILARENATLAEIVEALRQFFLSVYHAEVVPALEAVLKKPFQELPRDQLPALGFVIGGCSCNAYLSEVWNLLTPAHDTPNSAQRVSVPGVFGSSWFASPVPICRYVKGYDPMLLDDVLAFLKARGVPDFTDDELHAL